jgi:NitT/TauT family transport system substrate-binding protein
MQFGQTRRDVLAAVALAGATTLLGAPPLRAEEKQRETKSLRLFEAKGSICVAPMRIAGEFLKADGFDVSYVPTATVDTTEAVGRGTLDFGLNFASSLTAAIDRGVPLTALAGVHAGCFGLFGHSAIRGITDLKGKTVAVEALGDPAYVFVSMMAAQIGIDPAKDINWVVDPKGKPIELFIEGKTDAFLGLPPQPQELRARHVGHLIVDSALDRPWSQYFCCMLYGNAEFVRKNPIATMRVLRAVLKASDLCAAQPEAAAKTLVDNKVLDDYDRAVEVIRELPYDRWREYDPEDTMRFYALGLHEAGLVKSAPNKVIADGTDWRFLNEVKRGLKG